MAIMNNFPYKKSLYDIKFKIDDATFPGGSAQSESYGPTSGRAGETIKLYATGYREDVRNQAWIAYPYLVSDTSGVTLKETNAVNGNRQYEMVMPEGTVTLIIKYYKI